MPIGEDSRNASLRHVEAVFSLNLALFRDSVGSNNAYSIGSRLLMGRLSVALLLLEHEEVENDKEPFQRAELRAAPL